jgi:transcriptional regulator with PAS, ATPase and Fis domain
MDVDIVDNRLVRIAGTNRFRSGVGYPINHEGNAFNRVLETKKTLVVEEPGRDEVCLTCLSREICKELYEICCPIILDNEVIGVISLATFDEQKKQAAIEKSGSYRPFLEKIASLIAAKAAENKRLQEHLFYLSLQKELLNHISDGVIVFDRLKQISILNKKAEQVLGNTCEQLKYLFKIKQFSIRKTVQPRQDCKIEYAVKIREKKLSLVGYAYPVKIEDEEKGSVFVFQESTILNRTLMTFQSTALAEFDSMTGKNPAFLAICEEARNLAHRDVNILICGETGSGKETFARAIHHESGREGIFTSILCSSSDESFLEKELMGSGDAQVENDNISKIELTRGGSLFLDEVGELTLRLQGRLMQVIRSCRQNDVRIIASSTGNLMKKMQKGEFRQDLYYSLVPFQIKIPPVRKRIGDVQLLIENFLEKYGATEGKHVTFDEKVMELFTSYSWPGNIRQIEIMISLIVSLQYCSIELSVEDLPYSIREQITIDSSTGRRLAQMEKKMILEVMSVFGSSVEAKQKVAKELGISVATLYRKINKYGIDDSKLNGILQ